MRRTRASRSPSSARPRRSTRSPPAELVEGPELLDHLAETGQLEGALATIDTMGCQVEIAGKIVAHKADFLLALKRNHPVLEREAASYFETAPSRELVTKTTVEKGRGRLETRLYASQDAAWIKADRPYPGKPRFETIATLARVQNRTEYADRCSFDARLSISSAPLAIERLADGARGHWGVESAWAARCRVQGPIALSQRPRRQEHGRRARFALGLARASKAKGSGKTRRKSAGWNTGFLLDILQLN